MKHELYKQENNLFQSKEWLGFQQSYGRTPVDFGKASGILLGLPFNKKIIWLQKSPLTLKNFKSAVTNLPKGTIAVRVEPEKVTEQEISKNGLRKVTTSSLLSGQASPKATRIINISGSEQEILASMKPKTRYNIRLAEKKGVIVRVADNVDTLYELLEKTAARDRGYTPHAKSYYIQMIERFKKDNLGHIFIADYKGEPLAAVLVSYYGEVATYLHGGFNDSERNLMAPYLCHWEAIRAAKERGCRFYDMWGVAETDNPSDPWYGISRFKEGFGGERVIFPGSYDLVIDKFWYNILTLAAKIKHVIRK
jgi:lipid II:glycine glycyltransferase (peptidoglycan interpeptide bridge formation enzyme)